MEIYYSGRFKKTLNKIKNKGLRLEIYAKTNKLKQNPEAGKPLKNVHKNHRSLRVKNFRIIYRIEDNRILIICFDHRKEVYD